MPKIPKVTRWTRFIAFLRGILLYNTVYWTRASDGLKPPKATREERRQSRPVRDLNIIRPREKPRAKLETEGESVRKLAVPSLPPVTATPTPSAASGAEQRVKVRKRRKHRRSGFTSADSSGSIMSRIFGRNG